ncbi:hypothetical protein V1264_021822 [Littorina saxatilis]|uniref:Reverse transcriptase domain-containing protein n=1 Tax=Littorina saxatilis TaxID=31220 RepID=A0AAN9AJ06_9CAEN
MSFAETNGILREEQHGFRSKRSCESQLLGLVDELSDDLEKGKESHALIMDFSKAFDRVCHELLLHKLHHYGIVGTMHAWIKGFLSDRQQAVVVDGATSSLVPVESGVPQGSVIGPALFLLYINDLPEGLTSTSRLFADDTLCHRIISSASDKQALQEDLNRLAEWEQKWLMSFHPDKCQTLPVSRKRNPTPCSYQLHGHTLSPVNEAKYLGVTLSHDLRWDIHILNITNKANQMLGFLRRNLRVGSQEVKQRAYFALIRSPLEFASPVWDPYTCKDVDRLEAVQRRAARWVVNRHRKTSSVDAMLEHLQWPTLQDRRRRARLITMYKFSNGLLSINTRNTPTPNPTAKSTRLLHDAAYQLPLCRTTYRQKSFFPRTIVDWNALPGEVALSPSLEAFKSRI